MTRTASTRVRISGSRPGRRPGATRRDLHAAGALLAALCGTAARAQAQGTDPTALAPVVVTATRTEARPFDVPASIDRIGGDAVRDDHAQINISESLGGVPGLIARDRQNYAQDVQISVRGFGAHTTFGIRGVRLYVDDVPATFPDGQGQITNVDLGSVGRIEVLRGPYSALYGNSSGGVVQVFTEEPTPEPRVDFSLGGGSFGQRREATTASGSSGNTGYLVSTSHFATDGYREHSAAERNLGNAKLVVNADDGTRITLIGNVMSVPQALDPMGLTHAHFLSAPQSVEAVALTFNTRKSVDQQQGGLVLEHALDAQNALRAVFYLGHRGTEQFQAIPTATQSSPLSPGGVIELSSDYKGTDLRWTLRSALAGAPFTLVTGLAVDELDQGRRGFQNFIGPSASPIAEGVLGALRRNELDTALDVDEYVQADWKLSRAWSVSAGLRHSSVRIESIDYYLSNGNDTGSQSYGAVLPVLAAMYAINDEWHAYASAGRGFQTPTLDELAYRPSQLPGLNFGLQSSPSNNLELGLKAHPRGLGEWTAAVYDIRTQREIVTQTNTSGRSVYQNAGPTERSGLELGWKDTYWQHLLAQAALTTQTATYRSAFQTCEVTPCAAAAQVTVAAGNHLPGVPHNSLFALLAWEPPLGWRASVQGRYVSAVFVNDVNSDAAPHYFVADASVGYVTQFGHWHVDGFLRGNNLFDRRYAGSVIVNETSQRYFEPAPGRNTFAGVTATLDFAAL